MRKSSKKFKTFTEHFNSLRLLQETILANGKNSLVLAKSKKQQSNITRNKQYYTKSALDINHLDGILKIDTKNLTALVEPKVTIEALVRATLQFGLIPKVVPEFKGITVGGAIMGASLESSSHLYGQFNDTCMGYEVLLGNGELIFASKEENSDLFYGISGSYGSLGIVTAAEIELTLASKWVHLHYCPISPKDLTFSLKKILSSENPPEFIDAIIFSDDHALIIEGRKTNQEDYPIKHLYSCGNWFYTHAETKKGSDELVPLIDYLFRYDKGAFWIGAYLSDPKWCFKYFFGKNKHWRKGDKPHNPFKKSQVLNKVIPHILGPLLNSQRLYKALHRISEEWFKDNFVIQDIYIDIDKLDEFLVFIKEKIAVTPLWICPVKPTLTQQIFSPQLSNASMLVDVGIYGTSLQNESAANLTQILEDYIEAIGGKKMFYTHSYLTKERFWKIYPKNAYDDLRQKYTASPTFLSIENKILEI